MVSSNSATALPETAADIAPQPHLLALANLCTASADLLRLLVLRVVR